EELEQYLQEFAARTGAMAGRLQLPERCWGVVAGAALSSNPNTVPVRIRISREASSLVLRSELRSLPWTRAKRERIAEHRLGQLADYLTARVRGSGPEKFGSLPLRAPYTPFGSGVAAVTASYAWIVLTALAAFAAADAALSLVSLPLMAES